MIQVHEKIELTWGKLDVLGKTIHKIKILQRDKKLERIDEPERGIQNLRKRLG